MKKLLYLILLLPGLLACCKEQSSGTAGEAEVAFKLSFNRSLPAYQTVDVNTKADPITIRNFICVYKLDAAGEVENQEKPERSFSWTGDKATYTASLPVGRYRVMAWSDYQEGSNAPYWNAGNFTSIKMERAHEGSDDYLRAYKGDTFLNIVDDGNSALTIPMASPMGKFVVLSTEESPAQTDGIKVRFSYAQYMSTAFGMFRDKPVDSQAGVSFEATPQTLSDGTVLLGFDWILTNGTEASVPVRMEILSDGDTSGNVFNLNIPVVRGKVTTVRGEFLTGFSQSAVSIDTEFDGTYTVNI